MPRSIQKSKPQGASNAWITLGKVNGRLCVQYASTVRLFRARHRNPEPELAPDAPVGVFYADFPAVCFYCQLANIQSQAQARLADSLPGLSSVRLIEDSFL